MGHFYYHLYFHWMMKRFLLLCFSMLVVCSAECQHLYKYRLWLKDKLQNEYSLDYPEEFLSAKSLQRRTKQGIEVDESDLPVSASYIEKIRREGAEPVVCSRWMNTVVVSLNDTTCLSALHALPFVETVECVWKKNTAVPARQLSAKRVEPASTWANSDFGASYDQLAMHQLDRLHQLGFRGEGMDIAVLDGGFSRVESSVFIAQEQLLGTKDFVHGKFSYSGSEHGAQVLSVMAADCAGTYVGSAPKANYWLAVTEDVDSEYPVEEDYWIAGAEWADSIGVDLINSSLGYTLFDDEQMDYTWDDLDGSTAFISKGATMAASKGICVVVAAGNEGMKTWQKISVPADADGILAVGGVTKQGGRSRISSIGNTADGRVKPDVMATGENTYVVFDNDVVMNTGTSLATPIICGGAACLWQAHPDWTVSQLIQAIRGSGSQAFNPDAYMGYGIPDFFAAHKGESSVGSSFLLSQLATYREGKLHFYREYMEEAVVCVYSLAGQQLRTITLPMGIDVLDLLLEPGTYLLTVICSGRFEVQKFVINY